MEFLSGGLQVRRSLSLTLKSFRHPESRSGLSRLRPDKTRVTIYRSAPRWSFSQIRYRLPRLHRLISLTVHYILRQLVHRGLDLSVRGVASRVRRLVIYFEDTLLCIVSLALITDVGVLGNTSVIASLLNDLHVVEGLGCRLCFWSTTQQDLFRLHWLWRQLILYHKALLPLRALLLAPRQVDSLWSSRLLFCYCI